MRDTPFNVLLVEDNPGDARLVTISLAEETGDAFRVEWVQDLATASECVAAESFDAILLDLNLPDSQGFNTFARMQADASDIPILVLTGLEDDSVGLRAIQRGAQDYLAKSELSGAAAARALRYAIERNRKRLHELRNARTSLRGKLIAFMGVKGGVGTTTVLLNVAALIAKNSRRTVAAVELRPDFGSFVSHLHETPAHTLADILRMDLATLTDRVIEKCACRSRVGFDVLFSPQDHTQFASPAAEDVTYLLERLAYRSFYTLVDLPSRLSDVNEAVLRACDLTVLVTERDPSSVAAAKVALGFLRREEPSAPETALVVVNRSLMIDGEAPKQIEAQLACPLLGVVPPAPDVAASAQKFGIPMALHRPLSAPAAMLNSITEKIVSRLEEPLRAPADAPADLIPA
ncbi:MAG: response regulator [Bryobacteraceae bacterium]|nr:response regulator [Bryobacteraceae bacterium]